MYQVRARPKDQSSDEDDIEPDHQEEKTSLSTLIVNHNNAERQSVSNDDEVDLKQSENKNHNVSSVDSDGNKNNQKSVDFSMFQSKGTRCDGNDKEKGIVPHCDAMQRLGEALKAYSMLNSRAQELYKGDDDEMEPEMPTFSEFIGSEFRVQFLEDFNHFMTEHQYFADEIKEEMVELFGLKRCNAMHCELTIRHFGGRRARERWSKKREDVRSKFYRQKFDSLHFHIFHLEESGYRYRSQSRGQNDGGNVSDDFESKTENGDDEKTAIDGELQMEVSTINDSKKKCAFGRFQGDGPNKYTLSVSAKTWMDRMVEYVTSQGIARSVITEAMVWLQGEGFDTDAIKLDANKRSVQCNESSLTSHMNHIDHSLHQVLSEFVENTKVPTFNVGLRFVYWEKCKGYKHSEFAEDDDLFIDINSAKYKDIKEELLESGHCDIFAFKVVMAKCTELMLCQKVRGMKASWNGTRDNPGYGIKKDAIIQRRHVECVVVYCDLTDFSTALSATFRHEFVGESNESIKERNRYYFHTSKGLREAVECFGKDGNAERGPFYCGMNCLLLLNQFGIRLMGPTSTSKSRAVAIRFAGEDGVVLKMDVGDFDIHHLDCVTFSQFPEEDERLFVGGRYPLMIQSVLVMRTAQNFAAFFAYLPVFDCMLSGGYIREERLPPKKVDPKLDHLIKWSLGQIKEQQVTYLDFVYQTFNCFRRSKTEILMDLERLYNTKCVIYIKHIVDSVVKRGWDEGGSETNIDWDVLLGIFPNVNKVTLVCGWAQYCFPLSSFLKKLSEEVFPGHHNLDAVVLKVTHWSRSNNVNVFEARKEELMKQLDPSVFTLSVSGDGKELSFSRV